MRPDLAVVTNCFAGVVVPDVVPASYISLLRHDPNWCPVAMGGDSVRTLRLRYFPDGVPFHVVLDRTADGWLPRLP